MGITVGLTLTSPVTDLKKKTISRLLLLLLLLLLDTCASRTRGEDPV